MKITWLNHSDVVLIIGIHFSFVFLTYFSPTSIKEINSKWPRKTDLTRGVWFKNIWGIKMFKLGYVSRFCCYSWHKWACVYIWKVDVFLVLFASGRRWGPVSPCRQVTCTNILSRLHHVPPCGFKVCFVIWFRQERTQTSVFVINPQISTELQLTAAWASVTSGLRQKTGVRAIPPALLSVQSKGRIAEEEQWGDCLFTGRNNLVLSL